MSGPGGIRGIATAVFIGLVCLGFVACAGSPKTPRKKTTVLLSEYDDVRVGREVSKDVATEVGLLDDPELTAYVNAIGQKLLRAVPRRPFEYQFMIVDQVEPNAFALPGGFVYLSRGLLALVNNEDELACVIGHEISHVAARHAAAQQAIGRGQPALLNPWVRAGRMASYGRDLERSADKGGQILCAAAGYDPRGMATFLDSLTQMERLRTGFSRHATFFDTHPGTTERSAVAAVRASEIRWKRDRSIADPRASLLGRIDGLPVGQRPGAGLFVGDAFLHPELDFYVRFPKGWEKSNTNSVVGAEAPRGQAIVFLMVDVPPGDPRQVAESWAAKANREVAIELTESRPVKVGSIDAWRIEVASGTGAGRVASYVTFIPYGDATWRITGASPSISPERFLRRTLSTARSFRPLTSEERASLETSRLRIAVAEPGEDLAALGRRTANAWNISETATHNGVLPNHRYAGGEQVKILRVEPYRGARP